MQDTECLHGSGPHRFSEPGKQCSRRPFWPFSRPRRPKAQASGRSQDLAKKVGPMDDPDPPKAWAVLGQGLNLKWVTRTLVYINPKSQRSTQNERAIRG